jgi:flagellar biosynthesis GTPase FlhF
LERGDTAGALEHSDAGMDAAGALEHSDAGMDVEGALEHSDAAGALEHSDAETDTYFISLGAAGTLEDAGMDAAVALEDAGMDAAVALEHNDAGMDAAGALEHNDAGMDAAGALEHNDAERLPKKRAKPNLSPLEHQERERLKIQRCEYKKEEQEKKREKSYQDYLEKVRKKEKSFQDYLDDWHSREQAKIEKRKQMKAQKEMEKQRKLAAMADAMQRMGDAFILVAKIAFKDWINMFIRDEVDQIDNKIVHKVYKEVNIFHYTDEDFYSNFRRVVMLMNVNRMCREAIKVEYDQLMKNFNER